MLVKHLFRVSAAIIVTLCLPLKSGLAASLQEIIQSRVTQDSRVEQSFLKVDEAFQFSFTTIPGGVRLNWHIAPGYYLYLERLAIASPTEPELMAAATIHQQAIPKNDPHFGNVHIFHDELTIDLPVSWNNEQTVEKLKVDYQGCAEAGLCYPPQSKWIELSP